MKTKRVRARSGAAVRSVGEFLAAYMPNYCKAKLAQEQTPGSPRMDRGELSIELDQIRKALETSLRPTRQRTSSGRKSSSGR